MKNMTGTTPHRPGQPLRARRLRLPVGSLVLAASAALAQTPGAALAPKATAQAPTGPMPVRVVCLAENAEDLFKNPSELFKLNLVRLFGSDKLNKAVLTDLKSTYPPVGGWHYVPIGSGFIVDQQRLHLVTNWHVSLQCPRDATSGLQIGIIEPSGTEITSILGDLQFKEHPSRVEIGNDNKPRKAKEDAPVRALCRDRSKSCTADSADNVEFFAPDLAVIKLRHPAQTMPIPLAVNPDLSGRGDLEIRGFPQVTMHLSQTVGGSRLQTVLPTLTPAKYSGPLSRDNIRPGLSQQEIVRTEMLMLAAQVHPGNSGGPVLADGKVVGVVTAAIVGQGKVQRSEGDLNLSQAGEGIVPAGYGLAVPVAEVSQLLSLVGVKPVAASLLASAAPALAKTGLTPAGDADGARPARPEPAWWQDTQHQLMLGLALCLLAAASAFGVMLTRRKSSAPSIPPRPAVDPITVIVPEARVRAEPQPRSEQPVQQAPATAPTPRAAVELSLSRCPQEGQSITLPLPNGANSLSVGRDPRVCQFVFPNDCNDVSGVHCAFTWNAQTAKLFVEDLRSTNATFVNGRKLLANTPEQLKAGDTVDLGAQGKNRFSVRLP